MQPAGAFRSSKRTAPHRLPGNVGIMMLMIMKDGNMECCFAGAQVSYCTNSSKASGCLFALTTPITVTWLPSKR
jgi:hypothetical protein